MRKLSLCILACLIVPFTHAQNRNASSQPNRLSFPLVNHAFRGAFWFENHQLQISIRRSGGTPRLRQSNVDQRPEARLSLGFSGQFKPQKAELEVSRAEGRLTDTDGKAARIWFLAQSPVVLISVPDENVHPTLQLPSRSDVAPVLIAAQEAQWYEARTEDGTPYVVYMAFVRQAQETRIAFTIILHQASIVPLETARLQVHQAISGRLDARISAHEAWWRSFWTRGIHIPDSTWQMRYQREQYRHAWTHMPEWTIQPDAPPLDLWKRTDESAFRSVWTPAQHPFQTDVNQRAFDPFQTEPTHTDGLWALMPMVRYWRLSQDYGFLSNTLYPALKSQTETVNLEAIAEKPYELALMRWAVGELRDMAYVLNAHRDRLYWNEQWAKLPVLDLQTQLQALWPPNDTPYLNAPPRFPDSAALLPIGYEAAEGLKFRIIAEVATRCLAQIPTTTARPAQQFLLAVMAAHWARADQAETFLQNALQAADAQPEPVSETGFPPFAWVPPSDADPMLAEVLHEMLVQSHGGLLRLFPAVPEKWDFASFDQLRIEGGWIVSAKRTGKRTTFVEVRATEPQTLRLRNPFEDRIPQWNRADVQASGDFWEVRLMPGQTLIGTAR